MPGLNDAFYDELPVFDGFDRVMDPALYSALPADWIVGFADVTGSTLAMQEGRYKAVNMAGAGVIAAVANAMEHRPFPYCFGGDGASFAIAPDNRERADEALRAMATFAHEELQIDLRIATAPVAMIREAGRDVRIARFSPSPHASYAMFSGGGLAWFEAEVKAGKYRLTPAPPGTRPDLAGLSCRWAIAPAAQGIILSLILVPRGEHVAAFRALVEAIIKLADSAHENTCPIRLSGMKAIWPGKGVALEIAARLQPGQSRWRMRAKVLAETLLATIFLKFGLKTGEFDAVAYTRDVAANADFRKFDDGLKMTLDCSAELADALEARLDRASDISVYGTFRQGEALMTCFVPSINDRGHVHFVDGAGGGYALAAQAMKARQG